MLISHLKDIRFILQIMLVLIHHNQLGLKDLQLWVTTNQRRCHNLNKHSSQYLEILMDLTFIKEDRLLGVQVTVSNKFSRLNNLSLKIKINSVKWKTRRKNLNSNKCNRSRLHRGEIIYLKGRDFYTLKPIILWNFKIWLIHLKKVTRIDKIQDRHLWVNIKIILQYNKLIKAKKLFRL